MMDFKEPGSPTAGGLTVVLVAGQNLAADARGDGGLDAASFGADGGIAFQTFRIGAAQFAFSGVGSDGHPAFFFVDMDLDRGMGDEGPPGGLFF